MRLTKLTEGCDTDAIEQVLRDYGQQLTTSSADWIKASAQLLCQIWHAHGLTSDPATAMESYLETTAEGDPHTITDEEKAALDEFDKYTEATTEEIRAALKPLTEGESDRKKTIEQLASAMLDVITPDNSRDRNRGILTVTRIKASGFTPTLDELIKAFFDDVAAEEDEEEKEWVHAASVELANDAMKIWNTIEEFEA